MLNPTLVRSRRRSGSRDSAYIRPLVEQLEKKTLLTVIYVNSSADSGGGTLRAAIEQSNGDPPGTDVISVSGIPQITLDSSITITAGVTINGAGVNITAPEGVFVVNTGPGLGQTVYMNYITTQSGAIPAAITVNQNSSLTVTNCNLYGYGQGAGTSGNGTGLLVQGTCVFNNGLLQGFDNGAVIGATGSYTTKNVAYYNNATTGLTTAGKTSESASYYWQNGNNSAAILNSGVLTETGGQILGNGIGAGLNSSGGFGHPDDRDGFFVSGNLCRLRDRRHADGQSVVYPGQFQRRPVCVRECGDHQHHYLDQCDDWKLQRCFQQRRR